MILLNSAANNQSLSVFPRKILDSASDYRLRIKDQQKNSNVSPVIVSSTIANRKVTITFTLNAVSDRWYEVEIYNTNDDEILYKGIGYAYNTAQDAQKHSIYYNYNTEPSANDNNYLTL